MLADLPKKRELNHKVQTTSIPFCNYPSSRALDQAMMPTDKLGMCSTGRKELPRPDRKGTLMQLGGEGLWHVSTWEMRLPLQSGGRHWLGSFCKIGSPLSKQGLLLRVGHEPKETWSGGNIYTPTSDKQQRLSQHKALQAGKQSIPRDGLKGMEQRRL